MTPEERLQRCLMYLLGCLLFSLGVKLFIDAGLGVDPLHAMVIGIVHAVDLPYVRIGLVASAVTVGFLALWSAWNRRLPPVSTFLTMAIVAFAVDLWNLLRLEEMTRAALSPVPMMLTGLLLDAYGSALIIMSGFGIRVMDLVAITMMRRWRLRFLLCKLLLEAGFILTAWIFGGPIGLATVAFLCLVGPFMEPMIWANRRVLHLPVWGFWNSAVRTAPSGRHYVTRGQAPSLSELQG